MFKNEGKAITWPPFKDAHSGGTNKDYMHVISTLYDLIVVVGSRGFCLVSLAPHSLS